VAPYHFSTKFIIEPKCSCPIYWAIALDSPKGNYKNLGEDSPKRPKSNGKTKLNSLSLTVEEWNKFPEKLWPVWEELAKKSEGCAKLLKIHKDIYEKYRDLKPMFAAE